MARLFDPAPRRHRAGRGRWLPAAFALTLAVGAGACGTSDAGDAGAGDPAPPTGTGTAPSALNTVAQRGLQAAEDNGCVACHRIGGGGIGPDWEGLAGSTVMLDDGSTVVADEEYLIRSVTEPDALIVDGYDIAMPARQMSDEDVTAIVAYITELGAEPAADPTT